MTGIGVQEANGWHIRKRIRNRECNVIVCVAKKIYNYRDDRPRTCLGKMIMLQGSNPGVNND
jgi:hypothetical protein